MDATSVIAEKIVNITYEDLPKTTQEVAKRCILDTLGVILAASSLEPACKEMVELVKDMGGKEESTIIGYSGKAPALLAAIANGSMSHAVDYDDVHDTANCHPSGNTVPAALAIGERVDCTGKELITAVALGIETACRLGSTLPKMPLEYDFFLPPIFGTFSSTAAAGKLLGLNEDQMMSAFGIAIHQAAGSRGMLADVKSVIRALRDGFSARNGILSALMAQRNIVGMENPLEGKLGLFNLYFNGEYNSAALTNELGKKFLVDTVSFKPWPSCRFSHSYITAMLGLVREYNIKPEDVKEITAVVGNNALDLCEPLENKRKPNLGIHAKVSLPFTLAVAVERRNIVLGDFLPENLKDPKVLRLASMVNYRLDKSEGASSRAIVEVKTVAGKQYSKEVKYAYGHPLNPFNMDDQIAKFRDCAKYSAKPLTRNKVEKLLDLLTGLENVKKVSQVTELLG
jgi:2-methylcitrate dehydratase PrpD